MRSSGMAARQRKQPDVFVAFYAKRQSDNWRNANAVLVAATGAIAAGLSILAGGMFFVA